MANTTQPSGFTPVKYRSGAAYSGETMKVIVLASDTNAFYKGDMLKFTGESGVGDDGVTYSVVTKAAAADTRLAGAVTGISPIDGSVTDFRRFIPSGTKPNNITLMVPQDRDVLYEVQENNVGGSLTGGAVESNIDFVVGTPTDATGQSGSMIASNTVNIDSGLPFRIVQLKNSLDNEIGADARWYVTINQDAYSDKNGI